jgi:hypothetical protein
MKISNTHNITKNGIVKRTPKSKYPMTVKSPYSGSTMNKALETESSIYYFDGDDNVIMYSKPDFKVVSDNFFAQNDLTEELQKRIPTKNWIYISPSVWKYRKELMEGSDIE